MPSKQKIPTGLAWGAYHRAIDWLRLGVKLKLELACVEINMINCVILRTSMMNSYAQPVGSRELDSLIWSCLSCALARFRRFRFLIQKINKEGRCGVLEGWNECIFSRHPSAWNTPNQTANIWSLISYDSGKNWTTANGRRIHSIWSIMTNGQVLVCSYQILRPYLYKRTTHGE